MQSPAPVKVQPYAAVQLLEATQLKKQLGRKVTGGLGGHQVEHEQKMYPCHKDGQ